MILTDVAEVELLKCRTFTCTVCSSDWNELGKFAELPEILHSVFCFICGTCNFNFPYIFLVF